MEQFITIELFGKNYTFKAETQIEKAREVAELIVKEVGKVQSQHKGTTERFNQLGIMILTAMNIASDNIETKENHLDFMQKISDKSSKLLNRLDSL